MRVLFLLGTLLTAPAVAPAEDGSSWPEYGQIVWVTLLEVTCQKSVNKPNDQTEGTVFEGDLVTATVFGPFHDVEQARLWGQAAENTKSFLDRERLRSLKWNAKRAVVWGAGVSRAVVAPSELENVCSARFADQRFPITDSQ